MQFPSLTLESPDWRDLKDAIHGESVADRMKGAPTAEEWIQLRDEAADLERELEAAKVEAAILHHALHNNADRLHLAAIRRYGMEGLDRL